MSPEVRRPTRRQILSKWLIITWVCCIISMSCSDSPVAEEPPEQDPGPITTRFTFSSSFSVESGLGESRAFTLANANLDPRYSNNGITIFLDGHDGTSGLLKLRPAWGDTIRVGSYETGPPGTPSLNFSWEHATCESYGTFVITTLRHDGPRLTRLRAIFEQKCEEFPGVLSGEVWIGKDLAP